MNEKEKSIAIELGRRIRLLREYNGLLQREFAAKMGISQQVISKCEGGKKVASFPLLMDICKEFGADISYFDLRKKMPSIFSKFPDNIEERVSSLEKEIRVMRETMSS